MLSKTVDRRRKKIAIVVSSTITVRSFLCPILRMLAEKYDVSLIVSNDSDNFITDLDLPVTVTHVRINRQVAPLTDVIALLRLIFLFCRERFDCVHTITPKAGLLGTFAAWVARVPTRIHTFQGEVWATRAGPWRWILRSLDVLVGRLATHLTVVSRSERNFLISEGIISAENSFVLASGSICGVDLARFRSRPEARDALRESLGICENDVLFLYLGRLNSDKGIPTLLEAFVQLAGFEPRAALLLAGPDEDQMTPLIEATQARVPGRVWYQPGYVPVPEDFMSGSDVIVLPSHREGFGLVVIEAGAMGIPAIGSDIYGIEDAIVAGETGMLFETGNVGQLCDRMRVLTESGAQRKSMGLNARNRVHSRFSQSALLGAYADFYAGLLDVDNA